jgi:hypothetical protein
MTTCWPSVVAMYSPTKRAAAAVLSPGTAPKLRRPQRPRWSARPLPCCHNFGRSLWCTAMFVLQFVQPGLAGLMDGSVSTLAPLFAAAFATHNAWQTFLVGIAASVGAGISMAFAEALSDDGSLTRTRRAGLTRRRQWTNDGGRRAWPHAALSHSRFHHCDLCCVLRSGGRARRNLVHPSHLQNCNSALNFTSEW